MRTILAILTLVLSVGLVGCGNSVAPTPIIVYVTPVPASSPAAVASAGGPAHRGTRGDPHAEPDADSDAGAVVRHGPAAEDRGQGGRGHQDEDLRRHRLHAR